MHAVRGAADPDEPRLRRGLLPARTGRDRRPLFRRTVPRTADRRRSLVGANRGRTRTRVDERLECGGEALCLVRPDACSRPRRHPSARGERRGRDGDRRGRRMRRDPVAQDRGAHHPHRGGLAAVVRATGCSPDARPDPRGCPAGRCRVHPRKRQRRLSRFHRRRHGNGGEPGVDRVIARDRSPAHRRAAAARSDQPPRDR